MDRTLIMPLLARSFWEDLYKDRFGLAVPPEPVFGRRSGDFRIPILVHPDLTHRQVFRAFNEAGVQTHTFGHNFDDASAFASIREPARDGPYVVFAREGAEPEVNFAGKSACDAILFGAKGMTLLERILFGFAFFTATGRHLDEESATTCSGSFGSLGDVLFARYDKMNARLIAGECARESAIEKFRTREVLI